ncbi:uncharacterized protein N7500_009024 [Penicillium coprophilum]|uniref:uncharacterized protein n=1 Tax=Penicillium coprophilum TaxID=36646 RepID=UPI002398C8B9|nr:uncharacterized protein N7500_009024 [Penicillium coprophilum]KAJ5153585.1 hypothetical protein N7500_009024 [Penicillium coprophilum]
MDSTYRRLVGCRVTSLVPQQTIHGCAKMGIEDSFTSIGQHLGPCARESRRRVKLLELGCDSHLMQQYGGFCRIQKGRQEARRGIEKQQQVLQALLCKLLEWCNGLSLEN